MTLKVSPAMAAGVTDRQLSYDDILARFDANAAKQVGGPYKTKEILI